MIKIIRKYKITFIALLLAVISSFVYCATTLLRTHDIANETQAVVRTYEVTNNSIDYQSILDEFENSKLETIDSLTTFEGYKTIDLSQLDGFDLVSDTDIEETQASVKYNFSYDSETNIVTLSAELVDELGEIQIDTITGAAFINEDGEIDAVMNVDGEGILLSEMQNAGMIENCGWFSRLIRKVVRVVVVAVTVAAVVATAAAVIVATAGSAAPALVAAGVGLVSSGVTTSVAAGAAIAAGATAAAITAGIGVGIAVGETITEIKDTTYSDTLTDVKPDTKKKNTAIFSIIPEQFKPRGLTMRIYPGTSNGRFIKWFDLSGAMIFEWDEDLYNGSHYHIRSHDGNHYLPGTPVPEPYASLYF